MSQIWVKLIVTGFHCWPAAPSHRQYLRERHRHLFHIKVTMEVQHDDREVEFHDLIDQTRRHWSLDLGWSCEMAAKALADHLVREYNRDVSVEVSEDGECGAVVLSYTDTVTAASPPNGFLSTRIQNNLFGKGYGPRIAGRCEIEKVFTVADLIKHSRLELMRWPNVGPKTVSAVEQVLADHGLALAPNEW